MEMMKLKVATKRMAGYTGVLGPVRFTDGVSDEFLPRHIRDRMAASMEFIEVDADGNEQPAGAQHRLLREYKERAPKMEPLARQTEAEKALEITVAQVAAAKVPALETRASLEAIAEKSGIKGLREIGNKWGVKHRSIPTLIEMILDAQEKSVAARNKKLSGDKPADEPVVESHPEDLAPVVSSQIPAEELTESVSKATASAAEKLNEALKAAAASGSLAAAVSAGDDVQE